nr:hypothetical protein [uncultured Mediterranean phage uvMED]
MAKKVYRFEYDGYIKDCRKCGGTFDDGFYVPKKTKTLKCPKCNHEGRWNEFQDLMDFDLGMIEDRFYRHKSDYLKDLEIKNFDKMIDNFIKGAN